MKKVFLSCLFFIALLIFPSRTDALRGRADCSFSPPQIQSGDNSVTFIIGSTLPGHTYEIVVDINKDFIAGTCTIDVVSPQITAALNTVSYTFTPQNEKCFDRLVAVKPDNHNDISFREVGGPLICTSEYTVASSCQLDFTPRTLATNQAITVTGTGVPTGVGCVKVSGASHKIEKVNVQNGSFSYNIGVLPTAGKHILEVGDTIVDPMSGQEECRRETSCQPITFTVGLPGQLVQNPGSGAGQAGQVAPTNLTGTRCGVGTIDTAVGCIPYTDTNSFIAWFLKWAIGIAGGIAFLMLIFSGFQIMTSSNNPQQLQTGRELLTGAVSGLILIVFSVFLLKLIGVDILGIPGLGNP